MSKEVRNGHGSIDFDRHRRFIEMVPILVEYARKAAEYEAYSYRGFKVGAAAEIVHPETSEFLVVSAGNSKPEHKSKFCAERRMLGRIAKYSADQVTGLVVVGTTDKVKIAEVTDFATPTLHPCAECRGAFEDHNLVHDHTFVLTTGFAGEPNGDLFQIHTIGELQQHYDEENQTELNDNVHSLARWPERLSIYDHLRVAENTLSKKKQRAPWKLTKMALTADLPA